MVYSASSFRAIEMNSRRIHRHLQMRNDEAIAEKITRNMAKTAKSPFAKIAAVEETVAADRYLIALRYVRNTVS